jgi:hypothetical protein
MENIPVRRNMGKLHMAEYNKYEEKRSKDKVKYVWE